MDFNTLVIVAVTRLFTYCLKLLSSSTSSSIKLSSSYSSVCLLIAGWGEQQW